MTATHIAQINIGVMVAPTDDPAVAEFMENLDRINAQADSAPGFVWRLQTESGNATDIQIFSNPLQLVNMSVWESVEELKAYVYRTEHVDFFRRRAEWFEAGRKQVALWTVDAGSVPELADAVRRVDFLERRGPTPYAFGFATPPPPLLFESATNDETGARTIEARCDGDLVGRGTLRQTGDTSGEITGIEVEPSVADLSIDAAIIDQLELAADALGITELTLPDLQRSST